MKTERRRPRVTNPIAHPDTYVGVKQEFKDEVNINSIVARMKRGIQPPAWMTSKTPYYGDFTSGPESLMEAYDVVARAEEAFLSLPVEFRREIDHDPRNLDTAPRELYEKYGLLKKPPVDDRGVPATSRSAGAGQGGTEGEPPSGKKASKAPDKKADEA